MTANYVLLGTQTVGNGGVASVTFNNIPQSGYTDLKIVLSARTDYADVVDTVAITFNANTSSYSWRELYANGGTAGSASGSTRRTTFTNGNNNTANTFGNSEIYIPNYTSANNKSYSADGVAETNAATSWMALDAGLWSNTAAITSISLSPISGTNWVSGSTFYLYGTAAVGTTPAIAPYASGGDVIANDGTYWYHAFKTTGAFVPAKALTADILVVAGGGGANTGSYGTGGGGGGLLAFTSQSLSSNTSYTCTVGAGGTSGGTPTNGSDSQFGSFTLVKGGGFGGNDSVDGATGGSGGGGRRFNAGGSATSGQGNAGGAGSNAATGGGGGAGTVGGSASGATPGSAGEGTGSYSTWASATATGILYSGTYYYAGGGAGVVAGPGYGSAIKGGTAGATGGPANTGSAAGALATSGGGSGIVIIRYAMV